MAINAKLFALRKVSEITNTSKIISKVSIDISKHVETQILKYLDLETKRLKVEP